MRKSQILATVSAIALSTAAAAPMAVVFTTPARADITIDWSFSAAVDLKVDAGTASIDVATEQENNNKGVIASTLDTVFLAVPVTGYHDYAGLIPSGPVTPIVVSNDAFAHTTGITGKNTVDSFTVTGPGTTGGGVVGAAEINRGTTDMTSSVKNTNMRIASEDLGAGSVQTLDDNLIEAVTTGNLAVSTLAGDINSGLTSTEDGKATVALQANKTVTASGSLIVGNMQINDNITKFSADVTTSRIGSQAIVVDDTTEIKGIPLSIQDNTVNAAITGNKATNTLSVTNGKDLILEGALGISSGQLDTTDATTLKASVTATDIEAGDTTTTNDPNDDLNGSSITFAGNDIVASAAANNATNLVKMDGVSLDGSYVAGVQDFVVNTNAGGSDGHVQLIGDIYVANYQFNEATVTGSVGNTAGDTDDGDLSVLVEDVTGSTVVAGDTDLKTDAGGDGVFDGNSILSSANGNIGSSTIDVTNVTDFSALTALGSIQNTDSGNQQLASTNGDIWVSVATLGGSTGNFTNSSLVVDGNRIGSSANTNDVSNAVKLSAVTITGAGVNPDEGNLGFMARSWHSNLVASASTDIALVSSQHTEDSTLSSKTIGSYIVDAADPGGAAGTVSKVTASVSGNSASALTEGNVVGENLIDVDATTYNASTALVSFQLVQDNSGGKGLSLSASVAPTDDASFAIVDLDSSALSTSDSNFSADGNSISAAVYGNLVSGDTNEINISAVTIGDNDMGTRTAAFNDAKAAGKGNVDIDAVEIVVDRQVSNDGLPQTTANSGIVLISDQSFEDSAANPVKATVTGNFVDVSVGSTNGAATLTKTDVSADDNAVSGRVQINTSNNKLVIGKDGTTQSLNANSSLINTQSFWDEEGQFNGAGSIDVTVAGDILVDANAGATEISKVNVTANGNDVLGYARLNGATNSVEIHSQTETVTNIIAGADIDGVLIGFGSQNGVSNTTQPEGITLVRAENGLLNDQAFNGIMGNGVAVTLTDDDIKVTVDATDGKLSASTVEADGNTLIAQSLGNEAGNSLTLDVGSFDISAAGSTSVPLGIIANAQRGNDEDKLASVGFTTAINDTDISASYAGVTKDVTGVSLSVDGNTIGALSRVNSGKNELTVSGTTYAQTGNSTPNVEALSVPGKGAGQIAAEDLAFGIASFQVNGFDAKSTISNASLLADAQGPSTIGKGSISVSGNSLIAEARSNDNTNLASIDFTTNSVSGFAANVQEAAGTDLTVGATVSGTKLTAQGNPGTKSTATSDSADVDGNTVAALSSANRALTNELTFGGTNLNTGSGDTTPFAKINPASATDADVFVNTDATVLNVQGAAVIVGGNKEHITADVLNTAAKADFDVFQGSSVSVDNNLVLGSSVIDSANNRLGFGVDYTVESDGTLTVSKTGTTNVNGATAAVVSQQLVAEGSTVVVNTKVTDLIVHANDISDATGVSASVSGNTVAGQGIGGTVSNRLDVYASANLADSGVATPSPIAGDLVLDTSPLGVNADFNILNYQAGEPNIDVNVEDANLLIDMKSKVEGDSLVMDNNTVSAAATGFNASNVTVLNAGASSNVSAIVLNRQDINDGVIDADIDDTNLRTFSETAVDSGANKANVSIDDNTIAGSASGNVAFNAIGTTGGATLQESAGAGSTIDPGSAIAVAVTGSDYTVLNWQSLDNSKIDSTVSDTLVTVDDFSGTTGVDNSSISVSGNQVTASAVGNKSENYLVLNTGTFQHPSSTVANLQTTDAASISASVTNASIGIGNTLNLTSTSSNSSFTVRGNTVGATAIGNSAVNSIVSGGN